ncbi:MAG: Glycerophosphocholine phosphodiesterase [Ramalina farinacea]|uniref:Glycerophosphocholine phosphodiesterase n=1 Tax=Ramalina farinacea TaxID=258253 RepID=A0AA43QJ67_9LECA|nr:Glycerophosphocholine phosphodiesterase [Ramalina farinacea]
MKFGRNLPRNQVPEWDTAYINYKSLKKLIKTITDEAKHADAGVAGADTAEFFYSLDRNLEDVDNFYNKKYSDATRRLKLLRDRYGSIAVEGRLIDREEVEDLMGALLELRGLLRKLQWYGEVNRRGFVKITKKLDKKVGHRATQSRYLQSKVDTKQFATNADLNHTINIANDWLSKLGDAKIRDDGSSTHSGHSLSRVSSRSLLKLPSELLDTLDRTVNEDDASGLAAAFSRSMSYQDQEEDINTVLALRLLQRAISIGSRSCIKELLSHVGSLEDNHDIHKRNCLHRFIVGIARSKSADTSPTERDFKIEGRPDLMVNGNNYLKPAAPPILLAPTASRKEKDSVIDLENKDRPLALLDFILDCLSPHQRVALQARDGYGRTPLHYAAQYGFVPICRSIISHMKAWLMFKLEGGVDATFVRDNDGFSPLHLSVMGGHPLTTKVLLDAEKQQSNGPAAEAIHRQFSKASEVLAVAVRSKYVEIVKLLVSAGMDVDHQDDEGETALHIAARFDHIECAEVLLSGSYGPRADPERVEKTFGWTALHVACVDGHLGIVKCLIAAGADLEKPDNSGWTGREHAALRGHLEIATAIVAMSPSQASTEPHQTNGSTTNGTSANKSLTDRKSHVQATTNCNVCGRDTEPIKSFGHRSLTDETMILVSLGSMDMRKAVEAVNLDHIPLADAHSTQLDTALSVVVSAQGTAGEPSIIDLPVQDNISTEPITFYTKDITKAKVIFDIVPTYAGSSDKVVGRGVALLASVKPSIGSKRITLQADVTVPIMAQRTMDVIGSVNFNFLIVTPFSHPNMTISEDLTYWKSMTSPMVIGHRGLGKNSASRNSLQLGENTIQSFIAAANLGAKYVEFDVQLTKDLVPVIYHDFLVSETGIDAPVHTLTLEQFLHVNDNNRQSSRPTSSSHTDDTSATRPETTGSTSTHPTSQGQANNGTATRNKTRSMSVSDATHPTTTHTSMAERMKHTRDFKAKGFKPNSRGTAIQAPFTTLEEMFRKLDSGIGFNIEMKYPMLHESEEQDMDAFAVELNSFVDTVLAKVYDFAAEQRRHVIFSSFNPDICLLLSFKQPSIPVLFLTDAGTNPVGDVRASSLQEAVRFASRWNLLGVVTAAEPVCLAPRLVRVVKESGLVCVSYGSLNNDPEKVKLQVREGIDAVIVDSVLAIRQGLTGPPTPAPSAENGSPPPPQIAEAVSTTGPRIDTATATA